MNVPGADWDHKWWCHTTAPKSRFPDDSQMFTVNYERIPAGAFFPHTYDMNVDPSGGRNVIIYSRFSVKSHSSRRGGPPYSCCQHLLLSTPA